MVTFTKDRKGECIEIASHPDIRYEAHPVSLSREFRLCYKTLDIHVIILLKCCVPLSQIPKEQKRSENS